MQTAFYTLIKNLALAIVFIIIGICISSCAATQQMLNLEELAAQSSAEEPADPAPAATPALTPAPAGYSKAEARRYYQAQLQAQKQGVPRKVKNSNNKTTEVSQQVQYGMSTGQLLISWGVFLTLGGAMTLCVLYLRGWRKAGQLAVSTASLDFERRRFDRLMAERKM